MITEPGHSCRPSLSPSSASEFPLQLYNCHLSSPVSPHLFSCLAALALAKDRPFQYLGTALRVLKEFLCCIHLASLHQFTHGMFCHSASLYHCFLVASLSTPPDFHLRFFNLHARRFSGVMCRTTLSKPRLTWLTGVNTIPRLLYGTYIHLQTPHNNPTHVDDTRSYRTYL